MNLLDMFSRVLVLKTKNKISDQIPVPLLSVEDADFVAIEYISKEENNRFYVLKNKYSESSCWVDKERLNAMLEEFMSGYEKANNEKP